MPITLTLDTSPPANPHLVLNDGDAITGDQSVIASITTTDFDTGAQDVSQMLIWGDVDGTADPNVQPLEADSTWIAYNPTSSIRLSTGSTRKNIFARLRDEVGNETLTFTSFIDLHLDIPVVQITAAPDDTVLSRVAGHNESTFAWQATLPFTDYQIRVVSAANSPVTTGVQLGFAGGSVNVAGGPSVFPALTPITTVVNAADLATASPGSTPKMLKIFVKGQASGTWSL